MGLRFWIVFNLAVMLLAALDLFLVHRKPRTPGWREAAASTAGWVALALGFNALLWKQAGAGKGLEFLTGYLIEYSLSADNLFLFVLIFSYFRIPGEQQHRVLIWGLAGAVVMRGIVIVLGIELVERFRGVSYLLGAFLLVTGMRLFRKKVEPAALDQNLPVRWAQRLLPVNATSASSGFVVRENGRFMLTRMALVLVVIEAMDLLFALDSIPAVFAVTQDDFIVYSSNICAILGLRSLYFLVRGLMFRLGSLQSALAAILCFMGLKMLVAKWYCVPTAATLAVVAATLATGVLVSLLRRPKRGNAHE